MSSVKRYYSCKVKLFIAFEANSSNTTSLFVVNSMIWPCFISFSFDGFIFLLATDAATVFKAIAVLTITIGVPTTEVKEEIKTYPKIPV